MLETCAETYNPYWLEQHNKRIDWVGLSPTQLCRHASLADSFRVRELYRGKS